MADFSAVIRRAISGLSTNTPEERGRIYERARATIQRQLDSLPEGMNRTIFETQLEKIENSILEIEQEYADGVSGLSTQNTSFQQNQTTERVPDQPKPLEEQTSVQSSEPLAGTASDALDTVKSDVVTPETIQPPVVPSKPIETAERQFDEEAVRSEPPAEETAIELPEVSSSLSTEVEPQIESTSENIDDLRAGKLDEVKSTEREIDSELQIPDAPKSEIIKPHVTAEQQDIFIEQHDEPVIPESGNGPIETPLDDVSASDKDSNLIDQAVSEIRSTLQEDASSNTPLPDPNLSFGFGEEALPEAPVPRQRKSPVVIVIAVLLLVLVALAFFFWRVGWQGIQDLIPQSTMETTEVLENKDTAVPEEQIAPADQPDVDSSTAEDVAVVNGEAEKFTQRLNSDGTEIDAGPASDLIDGLPNEEGRSVAAADATDDTTPSEPDTAQADNGETALQKMFFYETSLGLEQQARYEGSVVWSEKVESDSERSRPYIEGTIQVPERDLSIVMTIKLNGDETLPVSHLIDLNFSLPEDFDGGEIEQITEVKFKSSEEQTGDRLEAISAKIDTSFFVVGLQNDKLDVVETNLQLMSQRGWIDIPLSYTNGRKALITLEKGASGKAVFDKVLANWKLNPAQ
ncbi:hypothetical protein [Lentilitoribacter sp. EG35]|uniref:hypothetical protein n=1 Tax=Lentilitoribacter sp. EG35 TaxID=3234192 RepID=UPI003460C28B